MQPENLERQTDSENHNLLETGTHEEKLPQEQMAGWENLHCNCLITEGTLWTALGVKNSRRTK